MQSSEDVCGSNEDAGLVDIVTVTFNSPPLGESFRALARCPEFRLKVVDNASDRPPEVPDGADLVRLENNGGFGAGCNRGWPMGDAPFVLFLNPDCNIEPEALLEMVSTARRHDRGRGVIVGPRSRGALGQRVLPAGREPTAWAFMAQYLGLARCRPWGFNVYDRTVPRRPVAVDWVGGGCLLISRGLLTELGGFDTTYFMYGEDVDLCLRARDGNAEVVLAGHVYAEHPIGHGSEANTRLRMAWIRNLRYLTGARRGTWARRRLDAALIVGAAVISALRLVGVRPSLGRPDVKMLFCYIFRDQLRAPIRRANL